MCSEGVVRVCNLADGVAAVVRDDTRHYFGGDFHVRLQVAVDVPLTLAWFQDAQEYEDAVKLLGRISRFSRTLEKMAVPQEEVEAVRLDLLNSFEANLLPYLSRPDFPCRFVLSEFRKARKSKDLRGGRMI